MSNHERSRRGGRAVITASPISSSDIGSDVQDDRGHTGLQRGQIFCHAEMASADDEKIDLQSPSDLGRLERTEGAENARAAIAQSRLDQLDHSGVLVGTRIVGLTFMRRRDAA
jgi:hypothetical protein